MYTFDSKFQVLLTISKLNVEDRRLHKDATTLCTLKVELEEWFGFAWGSHPDGENLFALVPTLCTLKVEITRVGFGFAWGSHPQEKIFLLWDRDG